MKRILYILLMVGLAACSPQKRMTRIAAAHPDAAAKMCASSFPVKESVRVKYDTIREIKTIPGPIVKIDCDSSASVRKVQGDTGRNLVYVPCPAQEIITEKVIKDSIVYIENKAALKDCEAEKGKAEVKADFHKGRSRFNFWWAIIATVVAAFLIIIKLIK